MAGWLCIGEDVWLEFAGVFVIPPNVLTASEIRVVDLRS